MTVPRGGAARTDYRLALRLTRRVIAPLVEENMRAGRKGVKRAQARGPQTCLPAASNSSLEEYALSIINILVPNLKQVCPLCLPALVLWMA